MTGWAPNRRLLADAFRSALRAPRRAAKPGRYAATKPALEQRIRLLDILAK
jgi:hypothetical protein